LVYQSLTNRPATLKLRQPAQLIKPPQNGLLTDDKKF
jgi:hypothetical protein